MERTIMDTTQHVINICVKSSTLQRTGNLNYYYVYVHFTPKGIPFYVGQGSHNRAYKRKGRGENWYQYVKDRTPVIRIVKSELSYQESLDLEKQLIEQYKETLINESYGHSPNQSFPVLCFTKKGQLVKRYEGAKDTEVDGFLPSCVNTNCSNFTTERSTHKGFVWCYEKDYEIRKNDMFKMGVTVSKPIEVIFPDGTIKAYSSMSSTKDDGFLPEKVRLVLKGERKSHKNCTFRFID